MAFDGKKGNEAQYNGQFFDSVTEATWAAYFDAAGMPYIREPQTFEFKFPEGTQRSDIIYTPDYFLPDTDTFVEVKNGYNIEPLKLLLLARFTGKAVLLADGMPEHASLRFYSPRPWQSMQDKMKPQNHQEYFADVRAPRVDWLFGANANPDIRAAFASYLEQSRTAPTTAIAPAVRKASKDRKRELRANRQVFTMA